jgi:uncharacterized protein
VSRQNVQVVRKMYEAFGRAGVDGMLDFMDPDVDHRAIEGAPDDEGVVSGHDAMRRHLEQWLETFGDLRTEAEELIDTGDQVIAMLHVTARMKDSHAGVEMRFGVVWTLRDGKVVQGREYATREAALEAVGLRE